MGLPKKIILKLNRKFKHARNELSGIVGLNERLYKNARGARIVNYHGICLKEHTKFNSLFVKRKTFEAHLQFYKKYFNIISLDDYYAERFSNDKFNICISFDDGFYNNYKYVLPLLDQYKIPTTFFVTAIRDAGYDILWNDFLSIVTKYGPKKLLYKDELFQKDRHGKYVSKVNGKSLTEIIRSGGFDLKIEIMQLLSSVVSFKENKKDKDYWLQMTPEQIKELSASELCTIGSHGYYHNDLARLSIPDAENEIIRSKEYLETIINKQIIAFAFPYGSYSRNVIDKAKKTGFKQLLVLDFLFAEDHTDTTMRERLTVNPYISVINQMHTIITGRYE